MKTLIDKAKKQYKYNCDRCKREISYKDNTLFQVHIKYKENKMIKKWDLCDKCYKAFKRAIYTKQIQK